MSYARMILNSTNLLDHRYKMKLETTATCDCNLARETIDHFLLECPLLQQSRVDLNTRIK